MIDTLQIIKLLTKQLSESSKEEDRIRELQPIDYILDYYANSIKGCIDPRDNKEYILEWKDEDDRIKVIQRYNAIVNRYNAEVKNNEKEFNKLLPAGDKAYSPSDLNFNKPLDYFSLIPLWAINCNSKLSGNIIIDDDELYTLLHHDMKDTVQFVEYLNKEIYSYIKPKVETAMKNGAWDTNSMWYNPNKKFLEWFDLKGIDPAFNKNELPTYLSKWAKEVVNLLKEHGETKNNDIIIALNKKNLPPSYKHICQIFKSESDRNFYKEELMNNGSYFSIKPTK